MTWDGNHLKKIGQESINKANEIREFIKAAPEAIRKLNAYGEQMMYLGEEYNKAKDVIDVSSLSHINLSSLTDKLSTLHVPSSDDLSTLTVSLSGSLVGITEPLYSTAHKHPELELLNNSPSSFIILQSTTALLSALQEIDRSLAETWKNACDNIAIGNPQAVKNSATHARTVVDELSWKVPYDHIKELDWCKLDEKGKPTRASRFAWLMHGDHLPSEIGGDPAKDETWKSLNKSYGNLNKYTHISTLEEKDVIYLRTQLDAIQDALEKYLLKGSERLKSVIKLAS